jgi:hypothetical protein
MYALSIFIAHEVHTLNHQCFGGYMNMEQAVVKTGRRTGWSESENKLLWETADEAQQQGLPLKAVF